MCELETQILLSGDPGYLNKESLSELQTLEPFLPTNWEKNHFFYAKRFYQRTPGKLHVHICISSESRCKETFEEHSILSEYKKGDNIALTLHFVQQQEYIEVFRG